MSPSWNYREESARHDEGSVFGVFKHGLFGFLHRFGTTRGIARSFTTGSDVTGVLPDVDLLGDFFLLHASPPIFFRIVHGLVKLVHHLVGDLDATVLVFL